MRNLPIIILTIITTLGMTWSFAWATGPDAYHEQALKQIPDRRPDANTVACRDLQIYRLKSMLIHVDHNPMSPQDYSEANDTVRSLLQHAEQLQKLCK